MKFTMLRQFLIVCTLLYTNLLTAQNEIMTIVYEKKSISYTQCAKGEEDLLTPFDRIKMQKIEEIDGYQVKILANDDIETTITHIKSDRFPSWMTMPTKTVIDKKGITSYDKNGKIVSNIPHDKKALESYDISKKILKNNGFSPARKPDKIKDADLDDLKKSGVKVRKNANGSIHIRNENKEALMDEQKNVLENREFDGKDLKYSLKQKFQQDKSGHTFVATAREIQLNTNDKGRKFWNFKQEDITNYAVSIPVNGRSSDTNNDIADIRIYPNPTTKELRIQIAPIFYQKYTSMTMNVVDIVGKIIKQQRVQYMFDSIDVEMLENGVYFLQFKDEQGNKLFTERFVKQ